MKTNKIIKVDLNKLELLKKEGGKLFFEKEAEEKILKLLELKEKVEEAIDYVKEAILKSGESMGIDFKAIVSDKLKVYKRAYGDRFEVVDETKAKDFIEEVIVKKIKTKEVENYILNNNKLPEGIIEKARVEKLVISKK